MIILKKHFIGCFFCFLYFLDMVLFDWLIHIYNQYLYYRIMPILSICLLVLAYFLFHILNNIVVIHLKCMLFIFDIYHYLLLNPLIFLCSYFSPRVYFLIHNNLCIDIHNMLCNNMYRYIIFCVSI